MRISLTPRAALVALLALPVIVLWPRWWVLGILAVLWAAVVLADALRAPDPRRMRVRREAPSQVRLGNTATGRLLLTNPTAAAPPSRCATPGTRPPAWRRSAPP